MPDDDALLPNPLRRLPHLRWTEDPVSPHPLTGHLPLRGPVVIAAFEGWNDAGDAATIALRHLEDEWEAEGFVDIDPEEFFDFSSTRPTVEIDEDGIRQIHWPSTQFSLARAADGLAPIDVVTLFGTEPQLRWRTFCDHVIGVAEHVGARLVVTLGALLAETPHTRPVQVFGAAYDPEVVADLGLLPSRYQGPTGIVGVLHTACRDAGIRSASLWAAVPAYLSSNPSPKAAVALVQKTADLLGIAISTTELDIAAASWERQVREAVDADEETAAFVARLEERFDTDELDFAYGDDLMGEIEQFLRDQRD